jgi:hypothetical protein
VRARQRVALLLNQLLDEPVPEDAVARSYRFGTGPIAADTATLEVAVTDVETGTYLVRVQVDGAESELELDASGRYSKPQVVVA